MNHRSQVRQIPAGDLPAAAAAAVNGLADKNVVTQDVEIDVAVRAVVILRDCVFWIDHAAPPFLKNGSGRTSNTSES
jgi:hypothetical protein